MVGIELPNGSWFGIVVLCPGTSTHTGTSTDPDTGTNADADTEASTGSSSRRETKVWWHRQLGPVG